ncbi:MAG: DUF445 family protein [Gemmatimonadaceae bacterium]|nr:DUF445 family protein [Gemmatimonadaceae bacterium]
MSPFVQELLLSIAIGTIAGGVTNAIAVWMLFHPYERRYGFHGAIPKNKARLAKSIGRTVGEKLLTPKDLIDELQRAGFRETLDARLAEFIQHLLEVERGSLREMLPAAVLPEVERALAGLGPVVGTRVADWAATPAFEVKVREALARLRSELGARPVNEVLTDARRRDLAQQAANLATQLIEESRDAEDRSAAARLSDAVLRIAGHTRTKAFIEQAVVEALGRAGTRTWSDVLDMIGEDAVVHWVLDSARSPRIEQLVAEGAASGATGLLDRPIGRPARFFAPETAARLGTVAGPALWNWLERELPKFVEQLDIPAMVERKVLGFSTARIEEIIRGVTQRELTMIVNLGYVLGAIIGVLSFFGRRLVGG